MNPDRQLQGSFWLMMAVQTIGAVDMPGKGGRKLPSPRTYVASIVVWSVLGLISDAGGSKAAAAMGWVTVLTGAIVGPFGKVITDFMNTISSQFGVQPGGAPATGGGPNSTTPGTP